MRTSKIYQRSCMLIVFCILGYQIGTAQTSKPDLSQYDEFVTKVKESPKEKKIPLAFVANPMQSDVIFNPTLKAAKSHNRSKDFTQLLELKEESMLEKLSAHSGLDIGEDISTERSVSFEVTQSYYADLDGGCPNDNTIAVGNDGKVISMMNGNVGIYNPDGSKLNVFSLESFFNMNASSPCDPKVEYDQDSDRYFMFVQSCGQNPDNVVMGFSQTNNPNGSWWVYVFSTDALGDGFMSDYPKVAITQDEVFVSLNLFSNGGQGSFSQSIVYQMDKNDGYSGNNLSYKIWDGFPSTTLIVRSGIGLYGPGAYTINASAFEGDKIILSDITRNLGDPNAQLLQYEIPVDAYRAPASVLQPDSDINLDTGDCRIQDGYYQDGMIHFVHTVSDENWAAVRYYRLEPTNLGGIQYFLTTGKGEKDYAYPSISPYTTDFSNQTAIIHFAAAGSSTYPEIRAKVFQHDFSTAPSDYVRGGSGGVHEACYDQNRGYSRWGDYSGIALKYNESTPTVYVAGSIAASGTHLWWTHINRLEARGVSTSTDDISSSEIKAFPNPAIDYISVKIIVDKTMQTNFTLYNNMGSTISRLYSGVVHSGENRFIFDTASLTSGNYYLTITNEKNEIIKTEKIVVEN